MTQKLAPNKNQRLQVKIMVISHFWATVFWTIIGTLSEFFFKKNRFKIKLRLKKRSCHDRFRIDSQSFEKKEAIFECTPPNAFFQVAELLTNQFV